MKNKKNKETLNTNNILYIIGFAILLFGLVTIVINKQMVNDRIKSIARIVEIENKDITLSNGNVENKTIYYVQYNTLDGEKINYTKEKKLFENFEKEDMFFVYYLDNMPENIIEETKTFNLEIFLIILGAGIVLSNLSLMLLEKERERKQNIQKNISSKENISFKIDEEMVKNIQEDVKMKETTLIDDDIEQINKENNEKSLLEKHLLNTSKVGTAYDANGNPINLKNNQLNTGSLVNGNTLSYGNNQVYGQNPNQGNYYGNSSYNNNYSYNNNNNNYYNNYYNNN